MNDSNTILESQGLTKIYKMGTTDLSVLKQVDLLIHDGDFVGIVGPSGAGKSTLLHILGGLELPTEGYVQLNGMDLYLRSEGELAAIRNEFFGFVFQFFHLFSELTVLENIMLPGLRRNFKDIKKVRERADFLLKRLGLYDRINHIPVELSGGEQQRVAIARALINKPRVLFCDEPTGNLDSRTGKEVLELLKEVNDQGTTILIVSHDKEIQDVVNRCFYIQDGVMQQYCGLNNHNF